MWKAQRGDVEWQETVQGSFPKSASDSGRVLARWQNKYGIKHHTFLESDDSIAFTITSELKKI